MKTKWTTREKLLMAAIAGMGMGAAAPVAGVAGDVKDEVRCFGVNSCGQHAKCAVSDADLKALKGLLGKDYDAAFGNSAAHSCGAHAKCGAESKVANWIPTTAGECSAQNGYIVSEVGKKKVAKKA